MTDDDGRVLDADYCIEVEPGGRFLSLVLESSSGASARRASRNVDYRPALRLLLSRLAARNAVLESGVVDSRVTRTLQEKDRRLFDTSIQLGADTQAEELRRQLCSAQSSIGQAPGATKGGNSTKRIRLRLIVPGYDLTDSTRLAVDLSQPSKPPASTAGDPTDQSQVIILPTSGPEPLVMRPASGSSAGYLVDPVLRRAIEQHAVRCAIACYPDHAITDVGATHSYDLQAIKDGEELHIEVKGSTATIDNVELTRAEVIHAHTTRTDLIVVDQITYECLDDNTIHTRGGRLRRWTNWQPADQALQPTRYRYVLPEHPPNAFP